MDSYIVNSEAPGGDHEVHNITQGCGHLPNPENWISLGQHPDCHSAVRAAKRELPGEFQTVNGCYYCCNDCHTG